MIRFIKLDSDLLFAVCEFCEKQHADNGDPNFPEYDILSMSEKQVRRQINGKNIAMIFQDPMTSLDPTMNIGKQIMEGMIEGAVKG